MKAIFVVLLSAVLFTPFTKRVSSIVTNSALKADCQSCKWGRGTFSVGSYVDHKDAESGMFGNVRFTCVMRDGKPLWLGSRGRWALLPYQNPPSACYECSTGDMTYSPGAVVIDGELLKRCFVVKDANGEYAKWN